IMSRTVNRALLSGLLMASTTFVAAPAAAQELAPGPSPAPIAISTDVQHRYSITVSPLLMIPANGVFLPEITGEYRLAAKWGVAGIVGLGVAQVEDSSAAVYEIGAQGRYYLIGSFIHGLELGVHTEYVHVTAQINGLSGVGDGAVFGPFVGYKIATNIGFT